MIFCAAGILTDLTWWKSCSGNHNSFEFMSPNTRVMFQREYLKVVLPILQLLQFSHVWCSLSFVDRDISFKAEGSQITSSKHFDQLQVFLTAKRSFSNQGVE